MECQKTRGEKMKSENNNQENIELAIAYCKSLRTNTDCDRVNMFNALRKQVRLDVLEDRYELAKQTINRLYDLIVEVKGLDKQFGVGEIRQMKE
jgi:hypothetical protein